MSFLWGLFGKTQEEKDKKEIDAIFNKVARFIENDHEQNAHECEALRQLMQQGGAVDENPGASGEFGRSLNNPIPVNGPSGELIYLSRLLTDYGEKVYFHRLGSKNSVDVYELVSQSGDFWDILYVDMYHSRKTTKAPAGYKFQNQTVLLRGINDYYPDFPNQFFPILSNYISGIFGIHIADYHAKQIPNIERPEYQKTNLLFYQNLIEGKTEGGKIIVKNKF